MANTIPTKMIKQMNSTPYITGDLLSLVRRKERMYKVAKKSNSDRSWTKYRRLRNRVATSLRTAKSHFFEDLSSKVSQPKDFWTALRKLSPKQDRIPFDLHLNNTTASATLDKANLLNNYFSSCFTPATNTLSPPNTPLSPTRPAPAWKKCLVATMKSTNTYLPGKPILQLDQMAYLAR